MTRTDDIRDEILFVGGLDSDTDPHFLTKGDWLEATNVIKSEDGKNGVLSKIKGNEEVLDFANYVNLVGWCKYHRNGSYILFIKGDPSMIGNPDKIVEYNPNTDEETTVIASDLLNFNTAYYVKADMIDDWLSWADGYNAPRTINVSDTKAYTGTITEAYLDTCRRPPLYVPEVLLAYDSVVAYSNLDGGYQFKYRYVYDDYRYSVYSKASDMVVPLSTTRNGEGFTSYGTENVIYIKFNSGGDTVGWVDVVVKTGNEGQWGRFIKIDKAHPENVYTVATTPVLKTTALTDNTEYYVRFINNEARLIVADGTKQYDSIPDIAESVSSIGENRFVWGGLTDGKELVALTATLTPKYNSTGIWESWPIDSTAFSIVDITMMYVYFDMNAMRGAGARTIWNVGDYVWFNYKFTITTGTGPLVITHNEVVYVSERQTTIDGLGAHIASKIEGPEAVPGSGASYNATTNKIQIYIDLFINISALPTTYTIDGSLVKNTGYDYTSLYGYVSDQQFKRNKTHKFGIVYSDKYGKKWPVITSSGTSATFAAYNETQPGFCNLEYTITSAPPTDAVSYRWVYAYKPSTFVQTTVTDVRFISNDETSGGIKANLLALDISANGEMTYPHYNFEEGDYIRIIQAGDGAGAYTFGDYMPNFHIFRVEEVLDVLDTGSDIFNGKWLVIIPTDEYGWRYDDLFTSTTKYLNALIEVYKPSTTETAEQLYYEVGGGGICENGTHKDWLTGTSTGRLNQGDTWYRPADRYQRTGIDRTWVSRVPIQIEDMYPFETANSRYLSLGDPNIEYAESIVKYENILRWTNKYFFDTKVNGLSTFDFDDKKEVSDSYGNIIGIEEQGNSLTVICEKKVLSTYVGATEYQDAQGNPQVITSDRVLGYLRPLLGDYGTFLKESICNNGEYIYFLDARNGCFIRKTVNGIFPISGKIQTGGYEYDYKMHAYFKNKCKALMASYYNQGSGSVSIDDYTVREYVKVFTGYDNEYKNVYVTFWDTIDNTNNETIIFHEPTNRWVSNIITTYGSESFANETTEISDISLQDADYTITNMATAYATEGESSSVVSVVSGLSYAYAGTRVYNYGIYIRVALTTNVYAVAGMTVEIVGTSGYDGTYTVLTDSLNVTYLTLDGLYMADEKTLFDVSLSGFVAVRMTQGLSLEQNDYICIKDSVYSDGVWKVINPDQYNGGSYKFDIFNLDGFLGDDTTGYVYSEPNLITDVDDIDGSNARIYVTNNVTLANGSNVYIIGNENIPDGIYEVSAGCTDDVVFDIVYSSFVSYSVSGSQSGLSEQTGCVLLSTTIMSVTPNITIADGTTVYVDGTTTEDGTYTINGSYTDSSYVYLDQAVSTTVTTGEVRLSYLSEITSVDNVTAYAGDYVKLSNSDSGSISGNNDGYYEVYSNCINDDTIVIDYHITDGSTSGTLQVGLKAISSIVGNKITLSAPISAKRGDNIVLENTTLNDGTYTVYMTVNDSYVIYTQEPLISESSGGYVYTEYALTDAFQGYLGIYSFFHSFLNGKLWKHNSSTAARCNFYGIQQNSTVTFVAKEPPLENKIFNSIEIHSNKKWEVTEITSPANETYVWGMYSRIKKGLLKIIDGVYKSNFLRNMKTTSSTATQSELYSGDELQGRYLQIKLTNDDTTAVDLLKVHVNSEPTK
jgi:hypothetical protein